MTSSNMNFGPEWMRKLSSVNSSQNPQGIDGPVHRQNDPNLVSQSQMQSNISNQFQTSYSSITGKYRQDDERFKPEDLTLDSSLNPFKYSKEFMVSIYHPVNAPLDFEQHEYVSVEESLSPVAGTPFTELEERLLASGQINSAPTKRNPQGPHSGGNQGSRNVDRHSRDGGSSRGRGGRGNGSNRNNNSGGLWNNVSKSSIGTFGADGVFRMEGASDSLEPLDHDSRAERFESERRAHHRGLNDKNYGNSNNNSGYGRNDDRSRFYGNEEYNDEFGGNKGGKGGRSSLKGYLAGLANMEDEIDAIDPSEVSNWFYNDPSGVTQGPFSGFEMHEWYRSGYFQGDLLVKREDDNTFEPLAILIARVGDEEKPFLTPSRATHLRTILTPRSSRFNGRGFEAEADINYNTSPFSQKQSGFNNFGVQGVDPGMMAGGSDLQQQFLNDHLNIHANRNAYSDAAFYQAQQERQLYLQQLQARPQMPIQQFGAVVSPSEAFNSFLPPYQNTGIVGNEVAPQEWQALNDTSSSINQPFSQPFAESIQASSEKVPGHFPEEEAISKLEKLDINTQNSKSLSEPQVEHVQNEISEPSTNESKGAKKNAGSAKQSPKDNKIELDSQQKAPSASASPKTTKESLPATPAPWQGSNKPSKSLREIQDEEAKAKAKSQQTSGDSPKRYADLVAKPTGTAWANAQKTASISANSRADSSASSLKSDGKKTPKTQFDGQVPHPSERFINWNKNMLRGFTGINVDDFINMLLSFPLNPPPHFKEIVREMFYEQQSKGNRNLVDSAKFAEEFVIRRKVDCGVLTAASLPSPSLKAPTLQKTVQTESFQVVGKKNRKKAN